MPVHNVHNKASLFSLSSKEFCRSSLYFQTLQACWEETYYNKQKKLMVHYLLLQSQGQVPPHVTTEHMSNWLVSQGKKSLRERVWKETLEEGNDLARLAWEVNTCLKMMNIEHEAFCKLRRSMYSTSPADIDPKVHSIVERAVSILGEQSNEPHSNLLSPSQVVVEVVPRLLLALWLQPEEGHSEHPILISGMAVGMVAAVVEKISCMLKDPSPHIPFSRAAAFDSVRSILGRISQSFSTDDLQSPFYMSSVCAFVADEVQSCFQPPAATLPVPPVLAVAVSTTLPADIQADADPASSHLEVVDITPNIEVEQASFHLEVVDITLNTEEDQASSHLEVVDTTPNIEADPASSSLEVKDITPNTEADQASSHLEVVDITLNTEEDQASSHLEVVDTTPNIEADPASSSLEVKDITPNTEADPASSHLVVKDITTYTEAEPISSILEVLDVTPEERTLTMAVFATLPADIQAEEVAVVFPDVTQHVTKDVTLDVPCRARKGAVRQFFCRLWRAVCCCACHKEEGNNINYSSDIQKWD
ncbi:uncharacterized protein LOC129850523 [Salvelinus fontinalis]|uniref:uncharacterized protein LOC129850522 n=1 Tax=Salvelinus fontinalis TaxID=8038 RepID=UPI002484F541|nr:uncharacterized protein LOC129850522 [Salvelinus fontinalis]XP_055772866.1 uncharacterized protein LOC129850523 [Salvelinus fontinalis]